MPRSFNPTKTRMRNCFIKGERVDPMINCIRLYESMCKPYFTAQIAVMDPINMINNMELKGGDRVTFSFDGGTEGDAIIAQTMYILSIDGEEPVNSLRMSKYTIYCATLGFFKDKGSLVQRAAKLIPATAMVAGIHADYIGDWPLQIHSSTGLLANMEIGGYQVDDKHPFKAIQDILDQAVGSGYSTGSWVHFLKRQLPGTSNLYIIAPLEHLFATASIQERFWQKQTWGSEMEDVFSAGSLPSDNAIIGAKTVIREKPGAQGGRAGAGSIARAAGGGALNIWEISGGSNPIQQFGGASGGFGGKRGGVRNQYTNDERRNPISTNQAINAISENSFQARVKDATNVLVKVPIQSGINVTVGNGACANLFPPIGDVFATGAKIPPFMMVAEAMHECYFDKRKVQGTSTFRMVAGFLSDGGDCGSINENSTISGTGQNQLLTS